MAQSKDYPTIKRLRGKIMVPRNIAPFETAEDGTFYSYDELWIDDAGHDVSTLEGCQLVMLEIVNEKKRELEDGGFVYDEILYDSDLKAETRYNSLAMEFSQNPAHTQRWKASGDTWVNMDVTLYQALLQAGKAHIQGIFTWLESKQTEIKEASSISQLLEVEI